MSMLVFLLQPSVTLLLLGICLWVSLRLLYGARGPAPDDGVYLFIRILSRALVLVSVIGLLVASANALSLILLLIIMDAVMELILSRRSAQRHAVWRALAPSFGHRPATVESLRFHQSRFTGLVGRWYRRLLDDVQRGVAWPEAISANRRALPPEAPAYLGVVEWTTKTAVELPELHQTHDLATHQAWNDTLQRFTYLTTVLLTLVGVLLFTMIKIVPSYQEIFEDFGLEVPGVTVLMIDAADWFADVAGPPILVVPFALAAMVVLISFAYLCDWPVLQPVIDWIGFARHRARVLRLLAAAFDHGAPLTEALARLESGWSAYPSGLVRRRLRAARDRIAGGDEWQAALQQAGLITATDAATLRAAQETGHLPWTMRMLADRTLRRFAFRWAVMQHILFTAIILVLGFFVFFFAVAMFIPVTELTRNLAS